jgi:hypothetical protein
MRILMSFSLVLTSTLVHGLPCPDLTPLTCLSLLQKGTITRGDRTWELYLKDSNLQHPFVKAVSKLMSDAKGGPELGVCSYKVTTATESFEIAMSAPYNTSSD